jgi:Domain of unknown function (DUF4287)
MPNNPKNRSPKSRSKDLKRLTRSRMKKTGESHAAARAVLASKSKQSLAERAGMSDRAVSEKTGRSWDEWARLLDARGARSMIHRDIAAYLHEEHGVSGWWAQMLTVGYERIRGLRDVGQRRSGAYEAGKSKTLPVSLTKLYRAVSMARARERWLPGVKWTVRKVVPNKSIRLNWEEGTSVDLFFIAKGPEKSQLAIQHRKLGTKAQVAKSKAYWGERLEELSELLTRSRRRKD